MTIAWIGLTLPVTVLLVLVAQNLNVCESTYSSHEKRKRQDHPTEGCHNLLLGIVTATLVTRMQHDACYPNDSTQGKQGN